MSDLPSYTPAQFLAMKREQIADRECPWCGAVVWDAGILTAAIQMDRMANLTFTGGMILPIVQSFVFSCTGCTHSVSFAAGTGDITIKLPS
jgi:hypothetical protein